MKAKKLFSFTPVSSSLLFIIIVHISATSNFNLDFYSTQRLNLPKRFGSCFWSIGHTKVKTEMKLGLTSVLKYWIARWNVVIFELLLCKHSDQSSTFWLFFASGSPIENSAHFILWQRTVMPESSSYSNSMDTCSFLALKLGSYIMRKAE